MDYNIYLSVVDTIANDLNNAKKTIEDLHNEYEGSYINSLSGSVIGSKCSAVGSSITRINNGVNNAYSWINDYHSELSALEANLTNFKGSSVSTPLDFLGNFTNPYAKATIPTLKTGATEEEKMANIGQDFANYNTTSINSTLSNNNSYAVSPHSKPGNSDERKNRLKLLVPEVQIDSSGYGYASKDAVEKQITTIEVPIWTGSDYSSMNLVVNKNIANNYANAFKQLADIKYPIDSSSYTGAYNYRKNVNSPSRLSDHSFGGAIDINSAHNPNGGNPDNTAYGVTEEVIEIMANNGFYWGGDFSSTKDPMHFSFAGY